MPGIILFKESGKNHEKGTTGIVPFFIFIETLINKNKIKYSVDFEFENFMKFRLDYERYEAKTR